MPSHRLRRGDGRIDDRHEGRVRLVLGFAAEVFGRRVEGIRVLRVLTHRHLGELGDHRVGG